MSILTLTPDGPTAQESVEAAWLGGAKAFVLNALARANTLQQQQYRGAWRSLHRFLEGEHLVDVQAAAHVAYPERSRQWDLANGALYRFVNLIQAYADRLAVCFHQPARFGLSRAGAPLPDSDPQVQQLHRDLEDGEWDTTLPAVEALDIVLGQCVVVPAWVAGKIRLYAYAPYEVCVRQSMLDPSDLALADVISLEIRRPEDTVELQPKLYQSWARRTLADGTIAWEYWCHDEGGSLVPNTLFPGHTNPYGMHPIVLWQTRKPAGGKLFLPPKEAWLRQQIGIDLVATDVHYGLQYAAHPQWVMQGTSQDGPSPTFGPDRMVTFTDTTNDLKAITPALNTKAVTEAAEWDLRISAVAESMPPDTYAPTAARSAAGIHVQRHDLKLRRERVLPSNRRSLRRLFHALRAVGNHWATEGAPGRTLYLPDVELTVEFAELPQVQDLWQEVQSTIQGLNAGLLSQVELELEAHPEIDRAEALRRVAQRQADKAATSYQPSAPAAATPGGGESRGVLAREGSGP